jgi:hypothetical protein
MLFILHIKVKNSSLKQKDQSLQRTQTLILHKKIIDFVVMDFWPHLKLKHRKLPRLSD